MDSKPSFLREIGKVAWFFTKILVTVLGVIALAAWLLQHHPMALLLVVYGGGFVTMILVLAWQNYKWERQPWVQKLRADEREKKRKASLGEIHSTHR